MNRAALSPLSELQQEGALTLTALRMTDATLPYERYEAIGQMLGALRDASAWWIGDWLVFGEAMYGEQMPQAAEILKREPSTLTDYFRVAAHVVRSRRRGDLSWTHHRVVARLTPDEQKEWLGRAVEQRWTAAELREQVAPREVSADSRSERSGTDLRSIEAVARRVFQHASDGGDGYYRVPVELIAQLGAALGEEK